MSCKSLEPAAGWLYWLLAPNRGNLDVQQRSPEVAGQDGVRGRSSAGGGETQFRRLLEKLPAGAYTCDAEGLITYFNEHAVRLWGREPALNDPSDRFCGSFKLFSSDGEPIDHDQCWMALALKTEKEYNGREIIVERPDGERLAALAHANPLHDESGKLLGAVNVLVDISERKRAEESLRRQEEIFRCLGTSSPVGIFLTDLDGRCTYANLRYQAICGLAPGEPSGELWMSFAPSEERGKVFEEWSARARDAREYAGEIRCVKPGEGTRWLYARSSPLLSDDGELLGHVGTVEDITDRKYAERALQEMREGERRRMARDLHDSVLQDLVGVLQGLRASCLETHGVKEAPDLEQEIDTLRRAIIGLRDAIYDLRHEQEQPFVRTVESLLEMNRQLNPEREFKLTLESGFPQELSGKAGTELLKVVQEALANARWHSRAARVEVRLHTRRGRVCVEVLDDGRGFDYETLRSGVGLSSMRERVLALGGELDLRSEPGAGTAVAASIPAPAGAAPRA